MKEISFDTHVSIRIIVLTIAITIFLRHTITESCEYDYKFRELELQRQEQLIKQGIVPLKPGLY